MNSKRIFRAFLKSLCRITLAVLVVLLGLWIFLAQPSCRVSDNYAADIPVDADRMRGVVQILSGDFHPRNFREIENLNRTADYIEQHFGLAGGEVHIQTFEVSGETYKNVRAFFGPPEGPRTIIGAHYDTDGDTPGADDNASGVAGLIELAYAFGQTPPSETVELVAYTLEEAPFFSTRHMGSYHHAKLMQEQGIPLRSVIVLEMIGYFSDEPGSQTYPARLFHLLYPSTGDFIAVIGKWDQRTYIRGIKAGMKGGADIEVYSVAALPQIPGVDFSDHRNYWALDYDAVMITNTAFYRNMAYHTIYDTWDRLNYEKMAEVVKGVYNAAVAPMQP